MQLDIPIAASISENFFLQFFSPNANHGLAHKQITDTVAFENLPPWPPISVSENKLIILSLKSNKAPVDFLLPELFKTHIDWWAPTLGGCSYK